MPGELVEPVMFPFLAIVSLLLLSLLAQFVGKSVLYPPALLSYTWLFTILGTLLLGGTMVDGKTTAPNEIRGKSLKGGVRYPMAVGDVFHIPAKIPHQMLVPKSLVIQVVKVDTK